MTRQKLNRTAAIRGLIGDEPVASSAKLTANHIERWAELIANGESHFPTDLSTENLLKLAVSVARRRRTQLVKYIARAIAQDIHGDRGP
jgi:hypothetical protein